MVKKFIAILVLGLLWSSNAYAYLTRGQVSCGTIISMDRENPTMTKGVMTGFVNGYITARNYETNGNVGKGFDNDSIYHALLKYCRENPLKDNVDASENVYNKLK